MDIPKDLAGKPKEIERIVKETLVKEVLVEDLAERLESYLESKEIAKKAPAIFSFTPLAPIGWGLIIGAFAAGTVLTAITIGITVVSIIGIKKSLQKNGYSQLYSIKVHVSCYNR